MNYVYLSYYDTTIYAHFVELGLDEPTEPTFMEKYLKAKRELGSEDLKILSVLFFGPPGAGKTTLLDVLLQKDIGSRRNSTGVLDRKLLQFKIAVNKEKKVSKWVEIKISDEISRLHHTIDKKIKQHASQQSKELPTNLEASMMIDQELQLIDDRKHDKKSTAQEQEFITNTNTLLACYDSGGQPEFFDVMPLLTTTTTGNIMIFDMSKDKKELHLKLNPNFYKDGKHLKSTGVQAHYTTVQLLKTALANIQSYNKQYSSCSLATKSHSASNKLLVVGTHFDQCGDTEDERDSKLHEMEQIIYTEVLRDYPAELIIKHPDDDRIVHAIANIIDEDTDETNQKDKKKSTQIIKLTTKDREEAAQNIRTAIENMSNTVNIVQEVPISWLLFQYEIKLNDVPCILRSDCDRIAENCYIDKKDVNNVLSFFHNLGILLYYRNVEGLNHVVFCQPQWLYEQLSKLIKLKYISPVQFQESIRKGIFKKQFLTKKFKNEFDTKGVLKYVRRAS